MAEAHPSEAAAAISGARRRTSRRRSRDPKVFVLDRELAEVHLLLDNVSANPNTTVAERTAETETEDELDPDWIEKICQISWPPDGSDDEKAEDAALLIRAKDHLNRLSYPASGSTIAFTTLVTQADESKQVLAKLSSDSGAAATATPGDDAAGEWAPASDSRQAAEQSPTRKSLAETAYPDLISKANGFRRWMFWISVGLLAALLLTCVLSWYVAYGNAALAELKTAEANLADANKRIGDAEAAEDKPPPPSGVAANALNPIPAAASAPAARAPFVRYCDRVFTSAGQMQACEARSAAKDNRDRVQRRLAGWVCWFCFRDISDFDEPSAAELSRDLASPDAATRTTAAIAAKAAQEERSRERRRAIRNNLYVIADAPARAAALANIIASAVLPFLYGLLGAGAAIIRSLSRKIRASLLSPRDLHLSLQQLALGAVMGACIGLFIAAPGGGKGESLLGPVALSGSAISFIAGFGVEAAFQALEVLIARIFNVLPAAAAPPLAVPAQSLVRRRPSKASASVRRVKGKAGPAGSKEG